MKDYFVDLHIHIGRTYTGKPVKITASKDLTLHNIIKVASQDKGIDIVGIIDFHVPEVQEELKYLIQQGYIKELPDGGYRYNDTTILLGSEIEIIDEGYHPVHYLCYFANLEIVEIFTKWLKTGMKNITLSSQRLYKSTKELQHKVKELDGLFIPAHIFTPYKGIYGCSVRRLEEICDLHKIDAVELGHSGDRDMADMIAELAPFTFVTNSDAHSLRKIAREYQKVRMQQPTFLELAKALARKDGRAVVANYGLKPELGKYHISVCSVCQLQLEQYFPKCPVCGGTVVKGVLHRIHEIADYDQPKHPDHRPPYIPQVPLEFLPGVGKKTYEKLLNVYGTEMNILHKIPYEQLLIDFGQQIATLIDQSRKGLLQVIKGGGGTYGKIVPSTSV